MLEEKPIPKNSISQRELETLKFWRENRIFEKSLAKPAPKGEFVFYEGPPTANGEPGIHHLEARAFKDAIPRYKTMRGFRVRRKGGWDTHGLPVELAVEKELGLKSKKEIETYGIEQFNKKCREDVWKYVKEWEEFTDRIGYWIDLKRPYVTYKPCYIESVWNIVSKINDRGLLYKDYKVVPWCPRCGTALSSHELAQGYQDDKDWALTVKFKLKPGQKIGDFVVDDKTYMLAWTTTPWTLPGNVALAVGEKIEYVLINIYKKSEVVIIGDGPPLVDEIRDGKYVIAKARADEIIERIGGIIEQTFKSSQLVGLEYEPLYPFLKDNLPDAERPKLKNAFKVYAADFVTTTEGTGIVHTAVMYGTDDFELGTKVGLPKHHLVNEDGTFKKETGFLAGKFVKDEATDVAIIKDLAKRPDGGLLFAKEKYTHSYPHCWRCQTPLIYFARDSWYIAMSRLRDKLVKENEKINWEPAYIKDGRFGEWLREVKDWAISRERYWGTPLPVWQCKSCGKREVVGSFDELFSRSRNKNLVRLILVRHGESEKNVLGIFDSSRDQYPLTKRGECEAKEVAKKLKKLAVAAIYSSPVLRARQTAEIIGKIVGKELVLSDSLWEVRSGEWDGQPEGTEGAPEDKIAYNNLPHELFYKTVRGKTGESWQKVEERVSAFAEVILPKHKGETVAVVSHEGPLMMLLRRLKGFSLDEVTGLWEGRRAFHEGLLGDFAEPTFIYVDARTGKEIDPHRPFIDEFVFSCDCGGEMRRVKEVMDVWFDSGAMPFAQDADLLEPDADSLGKNSPESLWRGIQYPADFISEAIDQTRGWFYTLHAVGALLKKGRAFKNVICLGHILDAEGKKMSKSLGNVVDPNLVIEKYGADALRFWMYSVNAPGEPKNFDEKTVDEIVKKVFNLAGNVLAFYQLYADGGKLPTSNFQLPTNLLDQWILARLNQLTAEVTVSLDAYKLLEPARAIRDFIADLSQWYLRRSRERIKNGGADGDNALATLGFVLRELSKVMAPFTPFFAEHLYQAAGGEKESVHLEEWPLRNSKLKKRYSKLLEEMKMVRHLASSILMVRAIEKVKTRQPLSVVRVSEKFKLPKTLEDILLDEVNVKKIEYQTGNFDSFQLDTALTSELEEEGNVRELIRTIQELRKEAKLQPSQVAVLRVAADALGREFLERHREEIARAAKLKEIRFEETAAGSEIKIGALLFKVDVEI